MSGNHGKKGKRKNPLGLAAGLLLILAMLGALGFFGWKALERNRAPSPQTAAPGPALSPAPTPQPTPEPDPEATPEPGPEMTELTLGGESAGEILALAQNASLRRVDGSASTEYAALARLAALRPDLEILWEVPFRGERIPGDTVSLTLTELTGLEELLPLLPKLEELDLLETDVQLEDLDRYYELRPDVFYLCKINFHKRVIRTDMTVYSSLQGQGFIRHDLAYYEPILKYCKKLRALDLGHNSIDDLSLIGELRELEILIIVDNTFTDASPLAKLHELTYLEIFLNEGIEDFSFLRELTKLQNLNACHCKNLTSLDFLEVMPDLAFGMFKKTGVSEEEAERWREKLPELKLVTHDGSDESTTSGWRTGVRYNYIRTAFLYWTHVVRYGSYDDVDFEFDGKIRHISVYKKRT